MSEPLLEPLSPTVDVQRTLGRIEGLLTSINTSLTAHFTDDLKNFENLRDRIGKVEKKVNWFSGAWAAVGAAAVYVLKVH